MATMNRVKIRALAQNDVAKVFQATDVEFPGESRKNLYQHLAFCLSTDKKFLRAVQAVQNKFTIQVCPNVWQN